MGFTPDVTPGDTAISRGSLLSITDLRHTNLGRSPVGEEEELRGTTALAKHLRVAGEVFNAAGVQRAEVDGGVEV